MGLFDNKSRMPDFGVGTAPDTSETVETETEDETIITLPPAEGTPPAEEAVPEEIALSEVAVEAEETPAETPEPEERRDDLGDEVGTIYGNVGTSHFDCHVTGRLERSEYVTVVHDDYGPVLCQVGSLVRKSNISLGNSAQKKKGEVEELISARIDVVGYRDERRLLQMPRTTFNAGAKVYRAGEGLIREVLGLRMNPKTDGFIGLLRGHGLPVALNLNELLQRHACILAKTGGGKSYMSGDIIEELMKHNVTCMVIDPHGEYGAMRDAGTPGDSRFNVIPRGYADRINEFAVTNDSNNPDIRPLRFTFKTLDAREILELTRNSDMRSGLPTVKKAIESLRETGGLYSVKDLIAYLEADGNSKNALLISELQYIDDMNVFDKKGNNVHELVENGKTTIINLKGVAPDIQHLIVKRLSTFLFELRKKGTIPPMMMVLEEAHNYCPQQGTVLSSKPLATIASEGRKFGLGLMVISQRPAKIDKNVLSQCGTQIILKVTNPNDLKAIAASIEGLTNGMTDDISSMPIGTAMVVGAGIESPLLVEVRPRESRHGGSGVAVLGEDE